MPFCQILAKGDEFTLAADAQLQGVYQVKKGESITEGEASHGYGCFLVELSLVEGEG